MATILLRAHKDPFRVVSPRQALNGNTMGENSGNLLFSNAAYKLLDTRSTTVETGRIEGGADRAARINERYDALVLPLANAFRPSFAPQLDSMSELIENLTIPVVVMGVGAQLSVTGSVKRLGGIKESTQRFVRAVLDRSPSIGVRGEYTADYLARLGFRDVEVIGCPSLFMYGKDLKVEKRAAALTPDSRVCINVSPYVRNISSVVSHHLDAYPQLHYVAQNRDALRLLLDGVDERGGAGNDPELPIHRGHPLLAGGRTRFFVDPKPWLQFLRDFDFSFGTRIHGNIAALLAGTPAYVLAHDSRTLELARYFDIPHRRMADVTPETDAAELYAEADYTAFNAGHAERFDRFVAYMERHGLSHVFQPNEDPSAFDQRVERTRYPEAVEPRRRSRLSTTISTRIPRPARRLVANFAR